MSFFSKYTKSAVALLKRNKIIFENFSYLTLFQVLSLVFPLITYPYLTRTLGTELYGLVITAQILSSYCSILIQFVFPLVSARHISLHKDNKDELSKIMSSILCMQLILWILSFLIYLGVIYLSPRITNIFGCFFIRFS
ncbi:MAG: oligosaccharide flippase family protein [Bacteroidales bacterium]|nr:oligosaccharide flippase family protein [Bacteroidales bacterium]